MVALGNTGLALVCVLALSLSHSGRHERTAVCGLLLCVGPIAGCSAVLAVRTSRYCGHRSLLCAFVVCARITNIVRPYEGNLTRKHRLFDLG